MKTLFICTLTSIIAYLSGFNSGFNRGCEVTLQYDYRCKKDVKVSYIYEKKKRF